MSIESLASANASRQIATIIGPLGNVVSNDAGLFVFKWISDDWQGIGFPLDPAQPPVQGEYLNGTFDFLDDVLIFEKILQGPERYRIGKPCKVRIATESAKPARSRARRYRIRNCSSPHGKWELCILSLPTYETE